MERLNIIFDGESHISVIGSFSSAGEALRGIRNMSPDVLMTDLDLPDMPGVEFIRTVKSDLPGIEIMVHTEFDDWKHVHAAFRAGATAYVLKGATPRALIDAVTDLYRGGAPLSPRIARSMVSEIQKRMMGGRSVLTGREKDVLAGLERRLNYRDLAALLKISPLTVRTHIRNIYEKLDVKSREEAILKAKRDGII